MEIEELRKTIDEADRQLKSCDDAFKGTLYTIYILGYVSLVIQHNGLHFLM